MTLEEIDQRILAAHEAGDGPLMADLYAEAGRLIIARGDIAKGCFFLTQGYVFALEEGMESASDIHGTLVAYGYER